jgi:GT2 family glycosyltransferase
MQEAGWQWKGSDAFHTTPTRGLHGHMVEALSASRINTTQRTAKADDGESITVVISHYERPQLLDQNLQALTRQTDSDFSVLVVDDGSQSADALRYLADVEERFRHLDLRLIRQNNRYLGAARNTGIRAAATEFVILLDDDNLAFPTMVATLRQAVRTMQADVVTCGICHFRDAAGTPDVGAAGNGPEQFFAGGPLLVGAVHNCFGDASAIYRRAVFDRVGYFHEMHGVSYEDWQMHLRVTAGGLRLVSLPEALVWYRVRPDSMLRTTHRHDNARVIASTIRELPCSALEPLADFLIGQEEERVRLNHNVEAIRSVAAAHAAALSEVGVKASQRAVALEQMLDTRTNDTRTAERYAQSLEEALAQARNSRDEAAEYARSLEAARAEAENYARHLEEELARVRSSATPASPPTNA